MGKKKVAKKAERRNSRRVAVNMWVREEREDYYFLYKATDISHGGFFLEKKIESPSHQIKSTFKFTLPKSSRLISVDGVVVFSKTSREGQHPGSGVKFLQMTNQDRKLITKFLDQN